MKICAVIPSLNHYKSMATIVAHLTKTGMPAFIIDDGSDMPARVVLASLASETDKIMVTRFEQNQGKGAAVLHGFKLAIEAGYTHALQVDADGQHDLNFLQPLLKRAEAHPEALISGQPIYDHTVPKARQIGRYITHVWVWIETLSFRITDSMCGIRVYPLDAIEKLLISDTIGKGMDFDTDIMVRLFWRGVAPIMIPLPVSYPPDNTSNFKMWRDNWRITKMHTRLVFTMFCRLPSILMHRPPKLKTSTHWSDLNERGASWGIRFCVFIYQLLGHRGFQIIVTPIVLYFYLMGTTQREASKQFLQKVWQRPSRFIERFHHQMNFAMRALDVLLAWTGDLKASAITATDPETLSAITNDPRGGLIVVAHLGNVDVAHASLDAKTRQRMTILIHTHHANNYNAVLRRVRHEVTMNILQVTNIGPATIIDLKQRVERGEWIVIAGDRTSVGGKEDNSIRAKFFGEEAAFPQGPWVLGALLECPVYLLFCIKTDKEYHLTMERFAEAISLPRNARKESLTRYVGQYAARLEQYSSATPLQWYNFYDFWART